MVSRRYFQWLDDLSLAQKGLLFVLFPLTFQLLLIILFWHFVGEVQRAEERAEHSTLVLNTFEEVRGLASTAFNNWMLSIIFKDSVLKERSDAATKSYNEKFEQLKSLVADDPTQEARLRRIKALIVTYQQQLDQARRAVESRTFPEYTNDGSATRARVQAFTDLTRAAVETQSGFHEEMDQFKLGEKQLQRRRAKKLDKSIADMLFLLFLSLCGLVALAGLLYLFYRDRILSRVKVVTENLQRISNDRPLAERLGGEDELTSIDEAIHDLSGALRDKTEETELFLYSISHDFRTPLVNLQGFSEELKRSLSELTQIWDGEDREKHRLRTDDILKHEVPKCLTFISASVGRFSGIIDALLGLSRAGRVEYKREQVDLNPILERIVSSLNSMITERKAEVRVQPLPSVACDRGAVERVLGNLLSNSLQYLDPQRSGVIEIGSLPDAPFGMMATIYVRDNGMGIPAKALGKVFLPFQRFHPDRSAGEGIGLSVVKRMLAKQGGKIWCQSEVGVGTTFYVSLPRSIDTPSFGGLSERIVSYSELEATRPVSTRQVPVRERPGDGSDQVANGEDYVTTRGAGE